jgi:hypothetical protein
MGWLAAAPHSRESENADQIVQAASKVLDLFVGMFGLQVHVRPALSG